MARLVLAFLFCLSMLHCNKLEITADVFHGDENKLVNVLSGNVIVKKQRDTLRANTLTIFTDKNKNAIKYIASGNVSFEIFLKDKFYKGRAAEFIYDVKSDTYELNKRAYIQENNTERRLYGDKIMVNNKAQTYTVFGESKENKPARFIFKLDNDFK